MTTGIWVSIAISLVAALGARVSGFLTTPATLAAALLGSVILGFGGWDWGVATAGLFLVTALISQGWNKIGRIDTYRDDEPRNLTQVLANGLLLVVFAIVFRLNGENEIVVAAFLGCLGAVAGDTWATASALFSAAEPRLVTTGKRVAAGTPGAITIAGVVLSALAGLLSSVLYVSVGTIVGNVATGGVIATLTFAAVVGAMIGSLFDSYLGAARQAVYTDATGHVTDHPFAKTGTSNTYIRGWRWLSNDLVNFCNSVAGALSAILVWMAAVWLNIV